MSRLSENYVSPFHFQEFIPKLLGSKLRQLLLRTRRLTFSSSSRNVLALDGHLVLYGCMSFKKFQNLLISTSILLLIVMFTTRTKTETWRGFKNPTFFVPDPNSKTDTRTEPERACNALDTIKQCPHNSCPGPQMRTSPFSNLFKGDLVSKK